MKSIKFVETSIQNSKYILYNISNYNSNIENSVSEILTSFVSVILEYMRFISEKVSIQNKTYYKFIIQRGIETLIHIFSFIFYYTKNLELTSYHTQKAYYFYIEFIEQMSDDNVVFLKLSSRDAILFVYKKTIYDINNEYKKNMKECSLEEKNMLSIIDSYIEIYKNIIQFTINNYEFMYDNKVSYINNCCNNILTISETLIKTKYKNNIVNSLELFINVLVNKQLNVTEFFNVVDLFIKKIQIKKKIDEISIRDKIYSADINTYLENKDFDKLCLFIFLESV